MDQYIGKLLDNRYEILECVGTGGMAVVYKARCHRLNRLVAVKILKPELAQDAEFRRRFHDESQAVAMLSHPNIVAVYDVSHSDDLDYIVMELIDGITLKQYMQKKGLPLNWREALHFITQIMKALSHAHDRGIIHRDIKPQNIMVLRDGSVKVADFGIARLASAAQSTLTQEALGSVHYISPEQARGSHIDVRSDIYSAGVVLYEMIAGRLPYEGDTPVSVAIQHINSIPLPPRDLNPDIPEALETITMKAMASDVEKRYVSADAMLADLEEFRKNPNINFDYTQEDLFLNSGMVDEPTLIRTREDTGSRRLYSREDTGSRRPVSHYDQENDEKGKEKGRVWPIVLAVGIIMLFIAGVVWFVWSFAINGIVNDQGTQYSVPDLRGMTMDEVEQQQALGKIDAVFTIIEGDTVASDRPAGQIVSQDPEPSTTKKGDNIIITVDISGGAEEQFPMPNVVNKEIREAMGILDQADLHYETEYENDDNITRNYIIRTEPQAGTTVAAGQTVTIVVSLGPDTQPVMVPSFTTQDIEWAKTQARSLSLVLDIQEIEDSAHAKGVVVYQSIRAGTEVEPGSKIILHVSLGPPEPPQTPEPTQTPEPEPTQTPEPEPTQTTTPTPTSTPTPEPPPISQSTTVNADLSGYSEMVTVRVEVGGEVQYNSQVDPTRNPTFSTPISGTGQQKVVIYINDVVAKELTVDFSQKE